MHITREYEVREALKWMKSRKSIGLYGIPVEYENT